MGRLSIFAATLQLCDADRVSDTAQHWETEMSDLRAIHASGTGTNNTGKIAGAIIVALGVCAVALYGYHAGMWNASPREPVPYSDLPSTSLPVIDAPAKAPQR